MKLYAYSKLNLSLDITGKLANGYHLMDMIMQSISIKDTITLNKSNTISVTANKPYIPTNDKNIAYKAAKLFFEHIGRTNDGISIDIVKDIPSQAGMAGGSADAAAVLYGLNKLYSNPLSQSQLIELSSKVGADVPFCLVGGTCRTKGFGETVIPITPIKKCFFAIAKPYGGISTPEAFKSYDMLEDVSHPDTEMIMKYLDSDINKSLSYSGNVLEQAVSDYKIYTQISLIKDILKESGCAYPLMTGSGSAVFGVFCNENDAVNSLYKIKNKIDKIYTKIATPTTIGVEIIEE